MKKIVVLATAALLVSGATFASKGKKCGKDCCKDKKEQTTSAKKSKDQKKA